VTKRRPKVDCIFCGDKSVPQSLEDVFPRWLGRTLGAIAEALHPGQQPKYTNYEYRDPDSFQADVVSGIFGVNTAKRPHKTGAVPVPYKLPNVCERCNSGWMSRLETVAKNVLSGFIRGNSKLLTPFDQFIIALWATKTCLAYDAALDERLIPQEIGTRRLYETGLPPPDSFVAIGHDRNHIPQGEMVRGRRLRHVEGSAIPGGYVKAAQFTFQFDHLILDTVINFRDDLQPPAAGYLFVPNPSTKRNLVWPRTGRFIWPSDIALSGDTTGRTKEPMPDAPT
jgi:hypothetical protein